MYEAVKAKKIPCALVVFEGEQHGFRKAENIQRALNSEVGREKELGNVAVKSADADTYREYEHWGTRSLYLCCCDGG